jgi:hypothetical protein
MKIPLVIAIAGLSYFAVTSANAVESLPQSRHKPLYSQQGFGPEARPLRSIAQADFAIPIRGVRPAHAASCLSALCPTYIVLGTSY